MNLTEEIKKIAWEKAKIIEGYDPDLFRKDACGAWIRRDMFGKSDNSYGWGVDLIFPQSLGGTNAECNLRAFNCKNLESKANDYPSYNAICTAEGGKNVTTDMYLTVNEKLREILKKKYENA